MSAMFASTLPMLVKTAANPTTECSAATVCGSSVAVMRRPISKPKSQRIRHEIFPDLLFECLLTNNTANASYTCELHKNVGRKADCSQGGKNSGANPKYPKNIALSGSQLGSKAR